MDRRTLPAAVLVVLLSACQQTGPIESAAAREVCLQPLSVLESKLTAVDAQPGDRFGIVAVSEDGGTALVGAPHAAVAGAPRAGAVYVFERSDGGWRFEQELVADDAASDDIFGGAVALSGDTAVVGARYAQVGGVYATGAAYVFTRSEGVWAQQAKLTAGADAAMDDLFGLAVALDGDTALVSAFADVDGRYDAGAVYVFVRTGESWTRLQRLTASDLDHNELFGWSVTLQGATAVVGAPGYLTDADPLKTGDAYVFERTGGTWVERQKLTASDAIAGAFFGAAAALDDARLLIGAPHRDDDAGAVYAFRRVDGQWTEEAKLVSGAVPQAYLGHVLGLWGTTAVVGAPYDDPGGVTGSGSALVFTHATAGWTPGPTLVAPDGAPGDAFGSSVGLGGGLALIGAHAADVGGLVDSGAVYVFWVADIAARAQEVVDVLDAAVAAGTLTGTGPGRSAEHRLGAVRRMLLSALGLIEQGDTAGACAELSSASSRIHLGGPLRPSHFVTGEAAYDLHQRILDLMEALGCG